MSASAPIRPGARNLITDVGGFTVGHATDETAQSGVTTLLCAHTCAAAVDVRGGGPGTRETEALSPENLVGRVHAIVLAGGSVFGLAAADGVAATLSARGIGIHLRPGAPAIPIVPSAVLHDLGNGGDKRWGMTPPYRQLGVQSLDAQGETFALGAVGAGRGAMAGFVKGGIGSASIVFGDSASPVVVGALAAVNCVGSALMPDGRSFWAWPFEIGNEFGARDPQWRAGLGICDPVPDQSRLAEFGRMQPGANTVLGIVACNADLTTAECKRVAIMAQDGIARAVRPAHTAFDGDAVFALATGSRAAEQSIVRAAHVAAIGSAAADCMARAIARGVYLSTQ